MPQLLARLHRHAGLTLSELLLESHSQLPRDATLLVLVQQINDASALALSLLQRRGYAVAAIINHYETQTMDDAAQRLASHSIPCSIFTMNIPFHRYANNFFLRDNQSLAITAAASR